MDRASVSGAEGCRFDPYPARQRSAESLLFFYSSPTPMKNCSFKREFMLEAISEALKAKDKGEIPVGAVIVRRGAVIGRGHNLRESENSIFSHAEINALKQASETLKDWRMEECQMYVTLEPCPMCSGTILQSRLQTLFFGSYNPKEGCAGSKLNLLDYPGMSWHTEVWGGIMEPECCSLLKKFFEALR